MCVCAANNCQMFCLYGVGEVTERSYMYRVRPQGTKDADDVPFRIDNTINSVRNNYYHFTYDKATAFPY